MEPCTQPQAFEHFLYVLDESGAEYEILEGPQGTYPLHISLKTENEVSDIWIYIQPVRSETAPIKKLSVGFPSAKIHPSDSTVFIGYDQLSGNFLGVSRQIWEELGQKDQALSVSMGLLEQASRDSLSYEEEAGGASFSFARHLVQFYAVHGEGLAIEAFLYS